MSTYILSACWRIDWLTPSQKLVLISLADQANDEGVCWPSVKTLGVRTCLSERAIRAALRSLEETGLLETDKRDGRSSYYTVTPANGAPRQMAPPGTSCRAPRQMPPPTPANAAPITINEPPENHQHPLAPSPAASEPAKPVQKTPAKYPDGQLILLPCTGGMEWQLSNEDMREMRDLYPGVDLLAEIRKARGWLIGNPTKRKTAKGMLRFLHNWLSRAQDRGGSTHAHHRTPPAGGLSVGDRIRARAEANDRGDFDERWFGHTIEHEA